MKSLLLADKCLHVQILKCKVLKMHYRNLHIEQDMKLKFNDPVLVDSYD